MLGLLPRIMSDALAAELVEDADRIRAAKGLNLSLYSTFAVTVVFIILAAVFGIQSEVEPERDGVMEGAVGNTIPITWNQPVYMPRHSECIDPSNGQEEGYEGFGIGYEPSLAIDGEGNMFITAHKDLSWGGEGTPTAPIFGGDPGLWWACTEGQGTSWDYWASWFWISNDEGKNWSHGADFEPTPGNMITANYLAGGSECLGDEGDIAVDGEDRIFYLDTTLEDNWWHVFTDGGNTYEMNTCQRMNTMAGDDRPWVAAQGDGIIHYLGNSGAPPPECTIDSGRYWYYHSENGGNTFSQCYSVPGGWSTLSSERDGPYVYIAQENADSSSGTVHIRISDDYGRGTGISDGTWDAPLAVGPRKGNCPEGYPVVNNNEKGTVAVVWADCPNGNTGPWEMQFAISYDHGTTWENWNITPNWPGMNMYPFVSITEDDIVTIAYYGLDLSDNYTEGVPWYLYAGALREPHQFDNWTFSIADPTPLHNVTAAEASSGDTHPLHDFFETVVSPDGTWMGIAYQQNLGQHPNEADEEQRYIKFVRGELNEMQLGSIDIESGGEIPIDFTCDGAEKSPQLMWSEPPNGTTSLSILVDDIDAPSGSFIHWSVSDISNQTRSVTTGTNGDGIEAVNGFGNEGWGGPCPPEGELHRYVFSIMAYNESSSLIGKGTFIATYER